MPRYEIAPAMDPDDVRGVLVTDSADVLVAFEPTPGEPKMFSVEIGRRMRLIDVMGSYRITTFRPLPHTRGEPAEVQPGHLPAAVRADQGGRDRVQGRGRACDLVEDAVVEDAQTSQAAANDAKTLLQAGLTTVGQRRRGPWTVGGRTYANRRSANRALAAEMNAYTAEQWREAQRQHGLR